MTKTTGRKLRLFTLGHSDLSLDSFFGLLEASSIRCIADIRSNPASSRFPQFERNALSFELQKRGFSYRWFRELGGKRSDVKPSKDHTALDDEELRRYATAMNRADFNAAVDDLIGLTASTIVVLLCAERDFRHCHRNLLADKLLLKDIRVVHIVGKEEAYEHVSNENLVVDQGRMIYRKRQLDLIPQ